MSNRLSFRRVVKLFPWVEMRIADICRCGCYRMSALASRELGFTVTPYNLRSARRAILRNAQDRAVKRYRELAEQRRKAGTEL